MMNNAATRSRRPWFAATTIRCAPVTALAALLVQAAPAPAATTSAASLASGFYRDRGTPTVYRVQNGTICAVLSDGHLKALGATRRMVQVLTNPVDFLNGKSADPPCPWPDGLYRPRGETTIIKINDGTACLLASTDQDVIEVASDDDVTVNTTFIGRCTH
jgi:hypothetical protein